MTMDEKWQDATPNRFEVKPTLNFSKTGDDPMSHWHVQHGGNEMGPLATATLRRQLASGAVAPGSLVRSGTPDYQFRAAQ
jgi:hypothetical protein